jgi:hypothetical protein
MQCTCMQVCVTLSGMQPDTKYWLTLPKGSRYSAVAGKLQQHLSVQFSSTLRFTTPFKSDPSLLAAGDFDQAQYQGANSRRLELFMPHGLDDAASAATGLQQRVRLTDHGIPFHRYQSIKNITGTQEPAVLDINATVTSAYAASPPVAHCSTLCTQICGESMRISSATLR